MVAWVGVVDIMAGEANINNQSKTLLYIVF